MSITFKVKGKDIKLDNCQIEVFNIFKKLKKDFLENQKDESFFSKILSKFSNKNSSKKSIQGLYLYGDVGRGKSMLMNNFYDNFPIKNKMHLHFNVFMQKIHRNLHKIRKNKDSNKDELIEIVTKNIIKNTKLLCLDEFQVDDVTDALILRRIFSYIFSKNIIVIFTSNKKPENLYQNGLQRDLFLKFVGETLRKNCQIYNLDSEVDYREKFLHKVKKHYFYPINQENHDYLLNIADHLTHNKEFVDDEIEVLGRIIAVKKTYENIAIFDFKELCVANLGVADYQAICQKYHIIFLLNIPKLTKEDRNEAKRFILLIDEIYENKNTLLALSDSKIEEIYEEGHDSEVFKRTISRLKEIMSDGYSSLNSYQNKR